MMHTRLDARSLRNIGATVVFCMPFLWKTLEIGMDIHEKWVTMRNEITILKLKIDELEHKEVYYHGEIDAETIRSHSR